MSLTGIVVAGTIGSWIGATVMYWVARWLGRPLLMRYGRYFTITPDKIERAEALVRALRCGGHLRVAAAARHPAPDRHPGRHRAHALRLVSRSRRSRGSALWCSVLAWVGVTAGQDPELLSGSLHRISLWVGGLMLFLGGALLLLRAPLHAALIPAPGGSHGRDSVGRAPAATALPAQRIDAAGQSRDRLARGRCSSRCRSWRTAACRRSSA